MKKLLFTTLLSLVMALYIWPQTPQGFNYQAVVRDNLGQVLINQQISFRISLLQSSPTGPVVYSETHDVASNQFGLVNIVIGQGTVLSSSFDNIYWTEGPYFIQLEIDANGEGYNLMGTNQLLSVPFSLFSEVSGTLKDGTMPGQMLYWNGENWVAIEPGQNGEQLTLCDGVPTWGNCLFALTLSPSPAVGGTASGAGNYEAGAIIPITATAADGWSFINWSGDTGFTENPDASSTEVTMPSFHIHLVANFEQDDPGPVYYNLNLQVMPPGAGQVSGAGNYEAGAQPNISAMVNPGWEFVNWTGDTDNVADPNSPATTVTMPAQHITLTANFMEEETATEVVEVTNPITGQTWMDRNLGASRAATGSTDAEAYGDLYQWGRGTDGHQKRTSGTSSILSSDNNPGHGNFILAPDVPGDWRDPQNNNLWQVVEGINNPCPEGFRLPTESEWEVERQSWSSNDAWGAFSSPLKLTLAGYRNNSNGSLVNVGSGADYWSSSVDGSSSRGLYFWDSYADLGSSFRAFGRSVRCIKDEQAPSTYNLTLEVNPIGAGIVNGSGNYEADTQVNITATANEGWEFVNWTGAIAHLDDENSASSTVTMPEYSISFTANFVPTYYYLTLNIDMSYAPDFDPETDQVYVTGTFAGFWPIPGSDPDNQLMSRVGETMIWAKIFYLDEGTYEYKYFLNAGWGGSEWSEAVNRSIIVDNDMVINDLWGHFILELDAQPPVGGTFSGGGTYPYDAVVDIEANSLPGWEFANWTGDTDHIADPNSATATVTMPALNIALTANFEVEGQTWQPCPNMPTVTDIDGNIYNTVLIGEQCWMKENLKTTQYRNATPIDYPGTDNTEWENNTTGAYAWYNNDVGWKDIYGAMYNWHAVSNNSELCPTGWKVPTNPDWLQLGDYLLQQGIISTNRGNALKSCRQVDSPLGGDCNTTAHPRWNANDNYGTDNFGFSGLPGGLRNENGNYASLGVYGIFWSQTEYDDSNAWTRGLSIFNGSLDISWRNKLRGYSIRCIKDTEPPAFYNLNLEVNPTGAGIVSGFGDYEAGTQVNITATANEGWEFVNWTGDTDHIDDLNSPTANVTMPDFDITLTASFLDLSIENVATLAALRAKPMGENVYCYTGQAAIVAMDEFHNRKYIQDETAAILINDAPGIITTEYELYDVITNISGQLEVTNNMLRFLPTENTAAATMNTPLEPTVSQITDITTDDQAKLARLNNLIFEGVSPGQVFENGQSYTLTDGTSNIQLFTSFWNVDYIGDEIPGGLVNITGVISQFNQIFQITPRFSSDIEISTAFYNLNLDVNPTVTGTVTGTGSYGAGTQVNITATSNPGWAFVNWTGDTDHVDDPLAADATVTMPAQDITLTANFEEEDTETEVVEVTNPVTGQTWMDRNLGASRAATSSTDPEAYGDLYQWGRGTDGHQKRTSGTTSALSSNDEPGHGNFILAPNSPYDWRSPQNHNLWQGVSGVNNPCPTGYRLPTEAEWNAERLSWSSNNTAGAFASPLKLPVAGSRSNYGSLNAVGSGGYYWSATVDGTYARGLGFDSSSTYLSGSNRASGGSVRCLKDEQAQSTYNLTLEVNPTDAGTVTGTGSYEAGTQVNITATANEGWEFVNWTGDTDHVADPNSATTTVTMPEFDIALTANFEEDQSEFICGNNYMDQRDGQVYSTIQIGNQCWMVENLSYLPQVSPSDEGSNTDPYYYVAGYEGTDVDQAIASQHYETFGVLYNWPASIHACPEGWRLPKLPDWIELTEYVSSQSEYLCNGNANYIAKSLAANSNWNNSSNICAVGNDLSANNATGFSGLPGGWRSVDGFCSNLGWSGVWWSFTESSLSNAWVRGLYNWREDFISHLNDDKAFGYSVRCTYGSDDLAIGDFYQGGIIAYIFQPGDPGYIHGEVHGLIAAPSDQGIAEWGCYGNYIGGTSWYLGTGAANTLAIIAGCTSTGIAAQICNDLLLNGYSDWYLPSRNELDKLYQNKDLIGGFESEIYWTSSEWSNIFSSIQNFANGGKMEASKFAEYRIRAIRTF